MDKKLKFILAAMSKVTGLTQTEITAKLKFDDAQTDEDFETALEEVLDSHAEKVKTKQGTDYSDGHKAGKKEVMTKLETDLRSKFKITGTDKKGIDLIDQIVTEAKGSAGDPAKLEEDAVKKHPAYLQLEQDSLQKVKDAETAAEEKIKEVTTGQTIKEKKGALVAQGMVAFDELKPILGETPTAQAKRRAKFEKALSDSIKIELTDKGDPILVDDAGKRLDDKHGHPVKITDLVQPLAVEEGFEFHTAKPRSSSGNGSNGGGNGSGTDDKPLEKKFKGTLPAKGDQKAYTAILADPKVDDEGKAEVMEHWAELNKT